LFFKIFDKAIVCDQGSNLVRLFKEILNEEICENDLNIFGNSCFYTSKFNLRLIFFNLGDDLDGSYSDFESENEVTENEDQLEERNSEQFKKRAGFNDTPLEDPVHEVTSILNDLMDLNTNN
jgi:hypothetical protein